MTVFGVALILVFLVSLVPPLGCALLGARVDRRSHRRVREIEREQGRVNAQIRTLEIECGVGDYADRLKRCGHRRVDICPDDGHSVIPPHDVAERARKRVPGWAREFYRESVEDCGCPGLCACRLRAGAIHVGYLNAGSIRETPPRMREIWTDP